MRWWVFFTSALLIPTLFVGADPAVEAWYLARFIAYLGVAGRSYSVINVYLCAVRHAHVQRGLPDPTAHPLVRQCLKAYKRLVGVAKPGKPKRAITAAILRCACSHVDLSVKRIRMLWACTLLAFACLLRSSEYSHKRGPWDPDSQLTRADVRLVTGDDGRPIRMFVNIKTSKTDVFHYGTVFRVDRTGGPLCAVDAVWAYMSETAGAAPSGPLFMDRGAPLAYKSMHQFLKDFCRTMGLDPKDVGTHSLRSGGATSLRAAGVPWETVKILGRWRSDCALRYSQLHPSDIINVMEAMQQAPHSDSTVSFSSLPLA